MTNCNQSTVTCSKLSGGSLGRFSLGSGFGYTWDYKNDKSMSS